MVSAVTAQNRAVLLQESFDGNSMPQGWSVNGMGTSNWSISASQQAGGVPNELMLYYSPTFNGTSRMMMPAVDLTGVQSAVVSFKHFLDNYSGANTIGIATTSDGGTTWNQAWQQSYSTSAQYEVVQEVSTSDFGQPNVQFCLYFTGNVYNINNWYFDDITIFTLENLDLGIEAIQVPQATSNMNQPITVKVSNLGLTPVTSVTASYQKNDEEPVVETFELNLESLTSTEITFTEMMVMPYPDSYNLRVNIDLVNGVEDDLTDNNTAETVVLRAVSESEKIPMIEHFSSSTCGPCVSVNNTMNTFCNNNAGRFTYTKYQMNWPGSGDPYYTTEGGVRKDYYGVNAVPQCFLDGEDQGYAPVGQTAFDEHASRPAFVEIRGAFQTDGTMINIAADVVSFIDLTNVRLYVSVNEKETHNNVGGNGETTFHHIFMKMLPNGQGETFSIGSMETKHIEYSFDMSSTHVEEMSDLEVSVWVQNYGSKEIYNSHFLYEETAYPAPVTHLEIVEDDTRVEGELTAVWEAPADATPDGYKVVLNGEVVAENTQETSYVFASETGNFDVVEVTALYGENTSVKAVASLLNTLGVGNEPESVCKLFPNPANRSVRIESNEDIRFVTVYNLLGAAVSRVAVNANHANLNVSSLTDGVYFVAMELENGHTTTQRLVVTH